MHPGSRLPALFLALALALAAAAAQAEPLGPGDISRFVSSLEELTRAFGGERNSEAEAAVQQWAEDGAEFPGIAQVMGRFGFTLKSWAETGERVLRAYAALKAEQQAQELENYMQATLEEIRNDPSLSPERKKQMADQVRASHAQSKGAATATAADKAAVAPFVLHLDGLFGL